MVPEPTFVPLAGLTIATVGGVVSATGARMLATVTVAGLETPLLPAASTATAVRLAEPSATDAEFHTKFHGAVVSEATT